MNRRKLLVGTILFGLAGCAVSTVNGVTTITLQLATVDTYAQAIQNGVAALLAVPAISSALGVNTALVSSTVQNIVASVKALDTEYAGAVSFSFSATTVPSAITSLQTDANTLLSMFQTAVSASGLSSNNTVETTLSALQTIVALVSAFTAFLPAATKTPMTEQQALAVLN